MVKNVINNLVFRIFTPLFYGVVMYVLILLIFDRVQQLSENFLIIESFLCVGITYLLFELIRWYILFVEKYCPNECAIEKRILIQVLGSVLIAVFITSIVIYFYFSKLVGFNTFRNELIVFNTIFLITSILYNMIYFSFFYLNRTNETELKKEAELRKNTEIELDTYKNRINPDFLYSSLETLISLSKSNIEEADNFIFKLSSVYRNILSTKNTEPVLIVEEKKIVEILVDIFNYKLNNNLKFDLPKDLDDTLHVISGTLIVVLEDIVNRTIISDIDPLTIQSEFENDFLKIYHPVRNKLIQKFSKNYELDHLRKAYLQTSKESFEINEENNFRIYRIPLLKLRNK